MESKNIIRKRILKIRNNLEKGLVDTLSESIISKLILLEEYKKSKTIMTYMSFNNEVNTFNLINKMFNENKNVIIPYTDIKNIEIIPVKINNIKNDLTYCKYGYLEPKKEIIRPIEIDSIDLIIIPGVVFDKNHNRIGFGKGYYDKLLMKKRADTNAIALAYDFQVLAKIPYEEHDIKMNKIITEKTII